MGEQITPERVAIVDDENTITDGIRDVLQTLLNETRILTYNDAETAFEAIVDDQPDLLILDFNIQDDGDIRTGVELLIRLKQVIPEYNPHVIFITANVDQLKSALEESDLDVNLLKTFRKPVRIREILALFGT